MKLYTEKTIKAIDSIYCDGCGKSCTITEPVHEHEYATIESTWGYFSNQDGTQYDIQICENCFNEVIDFLKKKRKRVLGCFNYPYEYDPLEGKEYL